MKKYIVAGSRSFNNYEYLKNTLDKLVLDKKDCIIVSGTARGADRLGEKWAAENGVPVEQYPADWGKFGSTAGFIRNADMAANADVLIAFWHNKSRGTLNMINVALKLGLEVHIIECENDEIL